MEPKARAAPRAPIRFETRPSRYKHWKLSFEGPIARVAMDDLDSRELGVDVELADIVERLRFEHPEVKSVIVTGVEAKASRAGAAQLTQETRLALEQVVLERAQALADKAPDRDGPGVTLP